MGTKLIEVALPLDAINAASAREKSIRHGHPSTLHLWWARRPLAACRAVLFASLVDDPSSPDYRWPADPAGDLTVAAPPRAHGEEEIEAERKRLHDLIAELVLWESTTNEAVLGKARAEIMRATDGNPPPVLDPFCGGGSIPLEAQRLGLEAHGSDLNPVAVLITKALIEIPPKFAGQPPVNPTHRRGTANGGSWTGAAGLAADVRHYGKWMRDEAEKRIGHLYPKVQLPKEQGGGEATVIAWLWARTVTCPNPACGAEMPLLSSSVLSSKAGREHYLDPIVEGRDIRFKITARPSSSSIPDPKKGYKRGMSGIFECAYCGTVTTRDYVAAEGIAGRLGVFPTAVVAESHGGRIYLPAHQTRVQVELPKVDTTSLDVELAPNPRDVWCRNFGLTQVSDLFTPRQLVALTTFSDLVGEARERVRADALAAGRPDDGPGIADGGTGANAYADAVATYLALVLDRSVDRNSTICSWDSSPKMEALRNTFARQAIPMTWDFAEGNPFSQSSGNWLNNVDWVAKVLGIVDPNAAGTSVQQDASVATQQKGLVSTDPPY